MQIAIDVLNVGDGDAILVHLKRSEEQQFIMLIDGGHARDADKVIKKLRPILKEAGKSAPDLVVCTHYDADHIGGLHNIVDTYKEDIGQIWMHQPGINQQLFETVTKLLGAKTGGHVLRFEEFVTKIELPTSLDQGKLDLVLESYNQMQSLVELINDCGIDVKEPFAGDEHPDWPEVKVLGPTKSFYKSCYDKIKKPGKLLEVEVKASLQQDETKEAKLLLEKKERLSCNYLDEQRKDHVTEINQVSVILEITAAKKKYLFTGDASIESFKNIPDYTTALKNIYWLKVAHHGSHNNSSSELFSIMSPEFAFISGGDRYLDDEVMHCLEDKNCTVMTTRDDGDLHFPIEA